MGCVRRLLNIVPRFKPWDGVRLVRNPLLEKPEDADSPWKRVWKIGSGTCPASPLLANEQAGKPLLPQFGFAAVKIARLLTALLNSVNTLATLLPFASVNGLFSRLSSLMLVVRYSFTPWLPT